MVTRVVGRKPKADGEMVEGQRYEVVLGKGEGRTKRDTAKTACGRRRRWRVTKERAVEKRRKSEEKGGESERVLLALACRVCLLMVIKCQAIYRACICRRLGHGTVRVAPYAR